MTAAHGREVDPEQVEKVARVLAELPFPDVSPMDYARAAVEAIAAYTGEVSGAWRCSRCSLAPESHAASECIYAPGWGAADTGEAQQAVERLTAWLDRADDIDLTTVTVESVRRVLDGAE